MFGLGLIPKKREDVDNRDILYSSLFKVNRTADRVRLDAREIKNQKKFGTCVAFAVGSAVDRIQRGRMSELYNYIKTKQIDPYPDQEGTRVSDSLKAYKNIGGVDYNLFPYDLYKKKMIFPPISESLNNEAGKNKIDAYVKITTPEELTDHLLHGNTAVGGFTVGLTSLFNPEHLANGDAVLDMPEGTLAGHAMEVLGIDWNMEYKNKKGITRKGYVTVVNSWGTEDRIDEFTGQLKPAWSKTGYGHIPFDYIFGNMYAPDGSLYPYVNELFVPLKDIPFDIQKIDPGNTNIAPYIKNGRTLVPLRFIGEALGMEVLYTEHDRGITISKNGLLVKLNVDSTDMQVNNNFINLDVPPEVKEGRTFVPLRAVAEAFGAEVNCFGYEQKVEIKYQDIILEMWIGRNEARKIKRL